jgi:predicted amidophosphoribosyltransferase
MCTKCHVEEVSLDGLCRDCWMDMMIEGMRCPDCGNVIGRQDSGVEVIDELVQALGWVHKDDCPRRHS